MNATIETKTPNGASLQPLVRKPRHKWFSAPDRKCDDGWFGPHETIEAAIIECASNYGREYPIYVAQGYKMTKGEREDWGAEFDWQVETQDAIEVRLPNDEDELCGKLLGHVEQSKI